MHQGHDERQPADPADQEGDAVSRSLLRKQDDDDGDNGKRVDRDSNRSRKDIAFENLSFDDGLLLHCRYLGQTKPRQEVIPLSGGLYPGRAWRRKHRGGACLSRIHGLRCFSYQNSAASAAGQQFSLGRGEFLVAEHPSIV